MPGLGLSYSETIGALHQLWRQGYLKCDFKAEQDRILAAIIRSQKPDEAIDRPEFDTLEETTVAGDKPSTAPGSDLAHINPDAPVPGASGATVVERTGIQRDTVPR
jgi:hypothetical protein